MKQKRARILVIKLSAFGDFIQALGPMAAIRKYHEDAHVTLLTTKMFEGFGSSSGYFDDIWIDDRPRIHNLLGWFFLYGRLNQGQFDRVYDLQNNDRTSLYFKLFRSKPEWVGVARGASHRNISPERTAGHAFDGHLQTLSLAGLDDVKVDDLSWIKSDVSRFGIESPYVLFVPGSAPQHPQKRWPSSLYSLLAKRLSSQGINVVLLGTDAEKKVTDAIEQECSEVINLGGKTSLFDIPVLARSAIATIGNDTGPMHMIGATGCPTLVLFSGHSNPLRHAPKGASVKTLQSNQLSDLSLKTVYSALDDMGVF